VTINLASPFPTITLDGLTIDASNAGVILDGSSIAITTANGLQIHGADGIVVKGLQVINFPDDGIEIAGGAQNVIIGGDRTVGAGLLGEGNLISGNGDDGIYLAGATTAWNTIEGNYIGTNRQGTAAFGNSDDGIHISLGTHDNTIGGSSEGRRNLISGNNEDGVFVTGAGTTNNTLAGNLIGTDASGASPLPNVDDGVHISQGASANTIGGTSAAERNIISGNSDDGVYLTGAGTQSNQVMGNHIGVSVTGAEALANLDNGVYISEGASGNVIGGTVDGAGNVISANGYKGILIVSADTWGTEVIGNLIGTNAAGDSALGNTWDGIEIAGYAHDNRVGGTTANERNVLSGNGSNGIIIIGGAHHNEVQGNLIGTDSTATFAIGGQPNGGVDLADGAQYNTIGGPTAAERNIISGNGVDGIFVEGAETQFNTIQGNFIGTDLSGSAAIPNNPWGLFILNTASNNLIAENLIRGNLGHGMEITFGATANEIRENEVRQNGGAGIHLTSGVSQHQVISNTITGNGRAGVWMEDGCIQNELASNLIYDNAESGIQLDGMANGAISAPELTALTTETITGTASPGARIEFFSDDDDEGRVFEGYVLADGSGAFVFDKPGGFSGPNVAATSTDPDGNTSGFSRPLHFLWTLLLFLSGDNDLEQAMVDTFDGLVAAGPSPRANVLVLMDRYTSTTAYSGTVLYDVTWGEAVSLLAAVTSAGERNMGDGQTLTDFVDWGRAHYPARYVFLAIVDHGGGWAPSPYVGTGALPPHERTWMGGGSGLSWDFTSGHDYLESPEIRQTMAAITNDGADPLDVVFYDTCLMGLTEVAYQIQEYATFFVSSQNIGWAPIGSQHRYVRLIRGIEPDTTPRRLAEQMVQSYADGMPPELHPFTISAVDLAQLPEVANTAHGLAVAISNTLTNHASTDVLYDTYFASQKFDYDSDFVLEPATDGLVDLYDFALNASQQFTDPEVIAAAQSVTAAISLAVVAEEHRSGAPWLLPMQMWGLTDAHGLSAFLPLGEDLELPIVVTETSGFAPGEVLTRNLRLRDSYTDAQLRFVADTSWDSLIHLYYDLTASPVPTDTTVGPAEGLISPDVTSPRTTISVSGPLTVGQTITVTWISTDTQSGVLSASLWHRPYQGEWMTVGSPQSGSSGVFSFTLFEQCLNDFAVQATDEAGNVEPIENESNEASINVQPCSLIYLPLVEKSKMSP
jgi:hypothetical protein